MSASGSKPDVGAMPVEMGQGEPAPAVAGHVSLEGGADPEDQLQLEQDPQKKKRRRYRKKGQAPVVVMSEEALQELTRTIQTLSLNDKPSGTEVAEKSVMISNLGSGRLQLLEKERAARKAIWKENMARRQLWVAGLRLDEDGGVVLKKVTKDKRKRTALSMLSCLWRDLLKSERTSFLFHEVYPLLFERRHSQINATLNCRLVCKEWRNSVDDYLQDPVRAAQLDVDLTKYPEHWNCAPDLAFCGEVGIISIFNTWSRHLYTGDNPFITRKLVVGMVPVGNLRIQGFASDPFWGKVEQLLRHWGKELWQLYPSFLCTTFSLGELFEKLCAFLRLTPNLKELGVRGSEMGEIGRKMVRSGDNLGGVKVTYRKEELQFSRLVPLTQLKILCTALMPSELHQALLQKYEHQLELLSMDVSDGITSDHVNESIMPHLKLFCFVSKTSNERESRLRAVNWPVVEEIRLMYHEVEAESIPVIFQNLNGFGKTLRKVMLILEKNAGPRIKLDGQTINKLSLELPLAEELFLFISRVNMNKIDFILPMRSLKELDLYWGTRSTGDKKEESGAGPSKPVTICGKGENGCVSNPSKSTSANSTPDSADEIIQFSNYTTRLYESNIWSLFPELRMVAINIVSKPKDKLGMAFDKAKAKRRVYTRDGYMQYCLEKTENGGGGGQ